MKVAFRLRRRSETAPATALLLPSPRVEDVLRLCVRLGDPMPEVHAVADGFLLKLPRPSAEARPGVLRLRSLAEDLLLPVDAELVPALLPDEATALVRLRGLVFLPGGRVLEFALQQPLLLGSLLGSAALQRRPWRPLPTPPPLAERLTEIVRDSADESPEVILQAGGEGIATEGPEPAGPSGSAHATGRVSYGFGRGLLWLGQALGLRGLAGAGARWIASALSQVPQLSAALLGRQEARLRELLRDFHEGNIERALRRALPICGEAARGAAPAADDRLPTHDLRYALNDLLGQGQGPGSLWFSHEEVLRELQRAYREQAELATRQGDYRRAAFIYGKLLGEYGLAARVLAEGGLHHDAALLYLAKFNDPRAAAREYEAAGEIDRAVQLYRQCAEHALAGDLLRRAGEEDQAIAEYQLAATRLLATGKGYYQAGELLGKRAGRMDLAVPYYEAGWAARPYSSAVPCASALAQWHASRQDRERLRALVEEAEQLFAAPGNDGPAAEFYNGIARLADGLSPAEWGDDLRDRALLGLAVKMRQHVYVERRSVDLVSSLLGSSSVWAPAVVSDAEFAVKQGAHRPRAGLAGSPRFATVALRGRIPIVRAVCWAPNTGDLFVGFASGEVHCLRPSSGEVITLSSERPAIRSLATSMDGDTLIVLSSQVPHRWFLSSFSRTIGYRMANYRELQPPGHAWLGPLCTSAPNSVAALWEGEELRFLQVPSLLPLATWVFAGTSQPEALLLLPSFTEPAGPAALLVLDGGQVRYFANHERLGLPQKRSLGWRLGMARDCPLQHPHLSWLRKGRQGLELAGIGPDGPLGWSDLEFEEGQLTEATTRSVSMSEPFLAATLVRAGLLAAVTATGVYWWRCGAQAFECVASVKASLPTAIACFPQYRNNELLVVCKEGVVVRVTPLRP